MGQFLKKTYPKTAVLYLFSVLIVSIAIAEPVAISISLAASLSCARLYTGKRVINTLKFSVFIAVFTILITPLTVHKGMTVLTYMPWGNPLTKESVIYGAFLAMSITSVILWSSVFSQVITSDKLIAAFRGHMQGFSAVLSLTLTLFPRFIADYKKTLAYQKLIHGEITGKTEKAKMYVSTASGVFSRSLENGITTASSMKSRGFGKGRRSVYIETEETKRDRLYKLFSSVLFIAVIILSLFGGFKWDYFFSSASDSLSLLRISSWIILVLFYSLPMIFERRKRL